MSEGGAGGGQVCAVLLAESEAVLAAVVLASMLLYGYATVAMTNWRKKFRRPAAAAAAAAPVPHVSPDAAPRPHPRHLILLHACQLLKPAREIVAAAGRRWPRRATMRARARGGDGGL